MHSCHWTAFLVPLPLSSHFCLAKFLGFSTAFAFDWGLAGLASAEGCLSP